MSKITSIHASVISSLAVAFPAKTRIPNAYSLIDNPKQFLDDGYGVKFNGSERQSFEICNRREKASFSCIVTKQFFKLDTQSIAFDSPEVDLLESVETFKQLFYANNKLNNSDIIAIDLTSSSGIENVSTDKFNILTVEVNFNIDYFETI